MALRDQILRHLATQGSDGRFGDQYMPRKIALQTRRPQHEVWEALWGMVGDGLIYLDTSGQPATENWHWRISGRGAQVATTGRWEPHDPDGYLRRLGKTEAGVDAVALVYLEEALRAFNAQCYLASSVMLGVASERVVNQLASALVGAFGQSAEKLRKALDSPRTSQSARFDEVRKLLESHRHRVPDGLAGNLSLDAVTELLRLTRNGAGHPTGTRVDYDTAYTHLQMAAAYLVRMTRLARHFSQTPPEPAVASAGA